MLLRRITEHVKDQNWFAVGLDFVIVVIGVFIGIQVSNWNNDASKQKYANTMLERLAVDLNNEATAIEIVDEYFQTVGLYALNAIDGFNGSVDISDRQFVISAYQASQLIFFSSYRSTYEQMIASGDINIAGNEDFQAEVIGYFALNWSENFDTAAVTPYRANIRRAIPHEIQSAIRKECGDQIIAKWAIAGLVLPQSCDLEMADGIFESAAAALRKQPNLLMDLRLHLSDLDAKAQNRRQQRKQIDSMLHKLENSAS